MSQNFSAKLTNLLTSPKEIQYALTFRKKGHIEQTVSASNLALAEKKATLEEKDGWRILRRNKKSIRMAKDKPFDEKLEDDIWCILAQMGYKVISKNRFFKIPVGHNLLDKQIDVFAKDDDTVLLIECTGSEEIKKKPLSNLIDKIVSIRPEVYNSIRQHFGSTPKLKMKWGIATRNIEWIPNDIHKCDQENIFIIRDDQINYLNKLTHHFRLAARYQLLAYIFKNEEIPGLDLVVPATRGMMGGKHFYNFLIKPHDLLKIAYISHKKGTSPDDFETYQRMLQRSRLKRIGNYIDNGGQFPTNIVINIKTKKELVFSKGEHIEGSTFGHLHLPTSYASAWIIDGQHRLYGYAYSKRAEKDIEDKTYFPVLAYINMPSPQEAQMFIDINCEQVKVSRNLLNEIYANLKVDSDIFSEQLEGICSRASMTLNSLTSSPIFNRLLTTNQRKTNIRCLTLNSFVDGLKENKFFGEQRKSGIIPGPLTASYSNDILVTIDKAVQVINYYLSLYKSELTAHWNLGDAPGGFLCTNNGIRVLLKVLNEILLHIEYETDTKIHSLKPEEVYENIKKYTTPIIEYIRRSTPPEINLLRSRVALKGVNLNTMQFLSVINKTFPGFHPEKLTKYLETVDEEGTKDARNLIEEIQLRLYNFILSKLKERYPGDQKEWWKEGVPEPVRVECIVKCEKEKGIKEPQQYLGLIDYVDILSKNWVIFEKYFTIRKGAGKKESLELLKRLNSIRNITHHPEKWPAEKNDVKFVREYHAHIINTLV